LLGSQLAAYAQRKSKVPIDSSFFIRAPFKNEKIVYEGIFILDSLIREEKLFNSIKKVLLTSTNYRYSKIDEDRILGTITSEFTFNYVARPGIADIVLTGKSKMSIDVKNGKYRIKIYDNKSSWDVLNVFYEFTIEEQYNLELNRLRQGKWKEEKSVLFVWDKLLSGIVSGFSYQIKKQLEDEF